ncbi:MAG: glycosyltransferase [Nitrospiraceae bacterium]|nr:MAG: glycosyltransferase [Nitrospiraceae bacterium]
MALRVLIYNWHEGYIHLLAGTGYQFDVAEVWKGNRLGWIKQFRDVPPNCCLVTEEEAIDRLRTGYYDRIISQNVEDLLSVYQYGIPIIQVFHTKFSYMTALLPEDAKNNFREKMENVLNLIKDITLVFVSPSKKADWGFNGEVILLATDSSEYDNYQGDVARVLRAGNGLTNSSMKNMRENLLNGLPYTVIGDNPDIPESCMPQTPEEYKNYLRSHRVYLNMLTERDDDGYNLSMLEAMATGMPVVSVANPSSPIIDGVNGYISGDISYLRARLQELLQNRSLAEALGRKARETVIEKFPLTTFIRNWRRIIENAGCGRADGNEEKTLRQAIFEKNLSALVEVNPELAASLRNAEPGSDLELVEAKNGMPCLKVNGMAFHSLYDPVKETREWIAYHKDIIQNAQSVAVLGFGLGYQVLELCKIPGKEITVFEPRLDVLKVALQTFCLSSVLKNIRIVTDSTIPFVYHPSSVNQAVYGKRMAILQHKPSVNANRDYYEKMLIRLKARERISKGLKILVIGPVYGGSLPIARYCSATLKRMGHTVELIDNSRFEDALFFAKDVAKDNSTYKRLMDRLSSFLSEAVIARCENFRPDLVFALAQAPLTTECLQRLKVSGTPTAFWFVEDFRLMNYWKNVAGLYDYFFAIQKGDFFSELEKAGIKNYHYLPLAADPAVHRKTELNNEERGYYGSALSFIGAGYYNRRHLFKGLLDYDFKIWGNDWDMNSALARCVQRSGGRVDSDETVMIFNASKININLHSSTCHKGINPFGDFVNPRTFEIAACGGFQLVDRRSELAEFFDENKEVIVFESLEDLRKKITYYLEHEDERNAIAQRARERVLFEHTYEHRMHEMLEHLADRGFNPGEENEGGSTCDLIERARGEGELVEYLSRYSGRDRITLADIVQDIENSEGDLTYPETVFLVMNEFVK